MGEGEQRLESTAELLARVRAGDREARERLAARYLPALRRWARGRVPAASRGYEDTDDLVQVSLFRALENASSFDPQRPGAFLAYLRTILNNAIRDRVRQAMRRVPEAVLETEPQATGASPLEAAIGSQVLAAYEAALGELPEAQRVAIMLRHEMGFGWSEIADAVGSPSPQAARMLVARGVARLAEKMRVDL